MPHASVLLVGEGHIEHLDEDIPQTDQARENAQGNFVDNKEVVKQPIRFLVEQPNEFEPPPSRLEDIDQIVGVSDNRADYHVDKEEDGKQLHLFHLQLVLKEPVFPLGGLGDEEAKDRVGKADQQWPQHLRQAKDLLTLHNHDKAEARDDQEERQQVEEDVLVALRDVRSANVHPHHVLRLLRPTSDNSHILLLEVLLYLARICQARTDIPHGSVGMKLLGQVLYSLVVLEDHQIAVGVILVLVHEVHGVLQFSFLLQQLLLQVVGLLTLDEVPQLGKAAHAQLLDCLIEFVLVLQPNLLCEVFEAENGDDAILYLEVFDELGADVDLVDGFVFADEADVDGLGLEVVEQLVVTGRLAEKTMLEQQPQVLFHTHHAVDGGHSDPQCVEGAEVGVLRATFHRLQAEFLREVGHIGNPDAEVSQYEHRHQVRETSKEKQVGEGLEATGVEDIVVAEGQTLHQPVEALPDAIDGGPIRDWQIFSPFQVPNGKTSYVLPEELPQQERSDHDPYIQQQESEELHKLNEVLFDLEKDPLGDDV